MNVMPCFRSVLLVAVATLAFVAVANAEMRIFELQHRPAAGIEETVRVLVDENARVAVHRNTLMVRSTPAELAEVAEIIASYDQPLSMLRISVEQGLGTSSRDRSLSASGQVRKDSVTLDLRNQARAGGNSIFINEGDVNARLRGQDASRHESRQASQFVTVLEGSPAKISVGRAVPFTSELRYYSRRHPHYVESVSYQNVDTGFEVLPKVQGNMVRLEIWPFMAFLDKTNPGQIVFQDMATTVNIPMGSWYDLSGHMSSHNELSREILGAGSQSGSQSSQIKVRIDPQ